MSLPGGRPGAAVFRHCGFVDVFPAAPLRYQDEPHTMASWPEAPPAVLFFECWPTEVRLVRKLSERLAVITAAARVAVSPCRSLSTALLAVYKMASPMIPGPCPLAAHGTLVALARRRICFMPSIGRYRAGATSARRPSRRQMLRHSLPNAWRPAREPTWNGPAHRTPHSCSTWRNS